MRSRLQWGATRAIAVMAGGGALALASAFGQAQGDPYAGLQSYDYQQRAPVAAIYSMIRAAAGDPAKTAEIEKQIDVVLQNPATTVAGKQEASRMLWMIGTGRSVPVLAAMLRDEKLQNLARYALERNTDPAAARALRTELGQAKGQELIGVINSLGDRRDPDAVRSLVADVGSSDSLVSEAAISALGKIGTSNAVKTLEKLPPDNLIADKALLRAGERLSATGKNRDAESLYLMLAGPSRPAVTQGAAIQELSRMKSPRAGAAAIAGLHSPDPYVQQVAARAAASLADPTTTQAAIAAFPGLPAPVRTIMLTAFADRHETAAAPLAIQEFGSTDPLLRSTAIQTAARVGGSAVVPRLAELTAHGDADGQAARDALATMPGNDVESALINDAEHGTPEVRSALMGVLAQRADPAVLAALLQSTNDPNSRIAVEAVRALGRAGGAPEHVALVKLLVDTKNDDVRNAARDAVFFIGQRLGDKEKAAEPVLAALSTASPQGKAALFPVLAEIGSDRALGELTRATSDANPDVKAAAIAALADSWPDTRPLGTLLGIAKNDTSKSLRVQALRGYLRLVGADEGMPGDQKAARLHDALDVAERPEEKIQILSVLRDARISASVQMAAKMLDDPALFAPAADTIIYLAAPQKKGDRNLAAVIGPDTQAALDKIIQNAKDGGLKARAQALRG